MLEKTDAFLNQIEKMDRDPFELQRIIKLIDLKVHNLLIEEHANSSKVDALIQEEVTKISSKAKLKAGRLTREVADSCLQFWGGNGFMADNPAAQFYRDGRLVSIGGGADEIMLGIICKMMDILPGKRK